MKPRTLLSTFAALAKAQHYQLQSYFPGTTFLDNFDFYTSWDPTFGFVHYVDRATAEQNGMISYTPSTTRWGVETTQVLDPTANLGRLSLRLTSKESWTHGLFVLDLAHMPHNTCGAWPAFWTVGSATWPTGGEIDVVEFTNNGPTNLMALHTLPGCTIAGSHMTGQLDYNDCNQADGYTGCAVRSKAPHGSGAQFNAIGGGVYAMEWTAQWVRVWFFPRGYIPESIAHPEASIAPDTSTFGVPVANFEGSCDLDDFLFNHSMIFNVDFCGSYAGNVFGLQGCPMTDPNDAWKSCLQYVALTPEAFTEVYWEVNHLAVYQDNSGWVPASSALSSVLPAASTSSVSKLTSNAQGRPTTFTMSLAGTTPTDISGTFSATSSALSVISSLSTASEASVSSSLSDALSPMPPTTTPGGLPFTGGPGAASTPASSSSPPPPPAVSTPAPGMSSSSLVAPPGVTFVTVVVPQTVVTVYVTPTAHEHAMLHHLHNREKEVWDADNSSTPSTTSGPLLTTMTTSGINKYGNCSFAVPRTTTATDFTCTFTKLGILSGSFYTERITFSTGIAPETGLTLLTFLTIDTISLQTHTLDGAALGATFTAITGNFTPTASSVSSIEITGYPAAVVPAITTPPVVVSEAGERL